MRWDARTIVLALLGTLARNKRAVTVSSGRLIDLQHSPGLWILDPYVGPPIHASPVTDAFTLVNPAAREFLLRHFYELLDGRLVVGGTVLPPRVRGLRRLRGWLLAGGWGPANLLGTRSR